MCYRGKNVGIVVPAYNEELLIGETIRSMPGYVDRIYIVDDCSMDNTTKIVKSFADKDPRIMLVSHKENGGVGASIISGFKRALFEKMDLITVMAGDNQMDPIHLPNLMDPIIDGRADFTKGNRLRPGYWKGMSAWRLFGNNLLNLLNKIATGYWNIDDPQNGYVSISSSSLKKLNLDKLYRRYAFENDMMVKAKIEGIRMLNVLIPAKYGKEKSKIRYKDFMIKTSIFLLRSFLWRIWMTYIAKFLPMKIQETDERRKGQFYDN